LVRRFWFEPLDTPGWWTNHDNSLGTSSTSFFMHCNPCYGFCWKMISLLAIILQMISKHTRYIVLYSFECLSSTLLLTIYSAECFSPTYLLGLILIRVQWFWNFDILQSQTDLNCGKNSKIKLQNTFFSIFSHFLRKWPFWF
jgi:hypothetical protein